MGARTGINGRIGAHRLRHYAATAVLAAGGNLTEAGQLLRHADQATTRIYARVDLAALRTLAVPWPGNQAVGSADGAGVGGVMTGAKTLGEYSADYLRLRRTMGHKLARHDWLLASFLAEQAAAGRDAITADAAIAWACAPRGATPVWWAARLSVVRGLAEYVHSREPGRAEKVPADAIPARVTRTVPYIYTQDQVRALMAAAAALRPPVRGLTWV